MYIGRYFVAAGLILLGACSGCGKNPHTPQPWKPEELERIVDVNPSTFYETQCTRDKEHWEQEEIKRGVGKQMF